MYFWAESNITFFLTVKELTDHMCVMINESLVESIQSVESTLGGCAGPVTEAKMPPRTTCYIL